MYLFPALFHLWLVVGGGWQIGEGRDVREGECPWYLLYFAFNFLFLYIVEMRKFLQNPLEKHSYLLIINPLHGYPLSRYVFLLTSSLPSPYLLLFFFAFMERKLNVPGEYGMLTN